MLTSPKLTPHDFGFKVYDTHIVISAATNRAKVFDCKGKMLHELACLPMGQKADWRQKRGDTPPGLYKLGEHWNDVSVYGEKPSYQKLLMQYGWITFDMVDLEGHEDNNGRSGICLHGGGSALGWPGAWKPYQKLYPTLGCVRMYNQDLRDVILPLYQKGTVYISVHQDEK